MAQEEITYTIASDGTANGSKVDVIVTYDPSRKNTDGSYTITDAKGTYQVLDAGGKVIRTDRITGLGDVKLQDQHIFIVGDPSKMPIVDINGIDFIIDNKDDSNDGQGNINLFDANDPNAGSPFADVPDYHEFGANINSAMSVTERAVCFVTGSLIRTIRGDVAVEDLVVGDLVVTASGALRPIRWLGHRAVDCRTHSRQANARPVRVSADAFGAGLPAQDLFLSPGHPVLVGAGEDCEGGHLVPIMCLINGTTIERVAVDAVTYWHVELDRHDILLAEGLPVESYIDLGSRPWFAGADGVLHDPDLALPDMPGRCRPVAIDGPLVEAERRRLDGVFAMRLAAASAWPTDDWTYTTLF